MKPGYTIVNHRLMGEGVVHLSCSKNTRRLEGPDMIVLHYTAGVSAASSADYLVRPEVKASAHLVIGRDGRIFQLVPFHVEAWHAGRSRYTGREGLNRFSIGIELDNLGRLQPDSRPGGSVRGLFGRGVVLLARLYGGAGGGVGKDSPFAS